LKKWSRFNAVDIFSGAGGMSIGAEWAGLEVVLAIENDKHAAETYRSNHPSTTVLEDDIRNISPVEQVGGGELFVLFGGPPCQGFSTSNTKTRTLSNENNSLYEEFVRFVLTLRPKWFVFENVEGFQKFNKGLLVKLLIRKFGNAGYRVSSQILEASDYGVPQHRNRFFMVGNLLEIDFKFPIPQKKKVTVKEAIDDLPNLKNGDCKEVLPYKKESSNSYLKTIRNGSKYALQNLVSRNKDYVIERYSYINPGQNWEAIPKHLMKNYSDLSNCHSGIYKRLHPSKPSIVISNYRKNMLIHPSQNRGLSVREAARLQSFPDSFIFKGPLTHIQQQIGNAVPPLLAKAVFDKIIRDTNGRRKI
jgi:DNA (cytosine-5)-methyltransferase 1